jgi:hypothetical protein
MSSNQLTSNRTPATTKSSNQNQIRYSINWRSISVSWHKSTSNQLTSNRTPANTLMTMTIYSKYTQRQLSQKTLRSHRRKQKEEEEEDRKGMYP